MSKASPFLRRIWDEIINSSMSGEWIEATIHEAHETPDAPFAEVAASLERMIAAGVETQDLCRLVRWASFESCFILLDMLRDPSIDKSQYEFFQEHLLEADPSGREGRPAPE